MGEGEKILDEKTVLVVDDSTVARKIVIRSLEPLGSPKILEADNGNSAIEMVKKTRMSL